MLEELPTDMEQLARCMHAGGLKWAVFGGLAARCYGAVCRLRDVDVITSGSLDSIAKAIPGTRLSRYPGCCARVIGMVEIWPSPLVFREDSQEFTFTLDRRMVRRIRRIDVPVAGQRIPVLSPEDVFVIKALQQRGTDSGKHDLDDLRQIWESQRIVLDYDYLYWRAARSSGATRVAEALAALSAAPAAKWSRP